MPAALSIATRRKIVERREQGQSFKAIAEELNYGYETVRKIYQRYSQNGELAPAYDRCRHECIRKNEQVYQRAIELKGSHPTWEQV